MLEVIDTVINHCIDSISRVDSVAVALSVSAQIIENASASSRFDWWPWIIAVFSFFLGLLGDAMIRKHLKRQSLKTMRDSIIVWYEKENPFLEQAITSFQRTADKILNNNNFQPIPAQVPLMDMSRINDFRLDELVDAFVVNMNNGQEDARIKNLYNLQKQCKFIDAAIIQTRTIYSEYISDLRKLMEEWDRAIVSMHTTLPYYHATANDREFSTGLMRTLSRLEQRIIRDGRDMDLSEWYMDFIEPAINTLGDTMRPINNASAYQNLFADFNKMHEVFVKFMAIKRYGTAISGYVDTLRTSASALNDAVTFFKEAKFKSFWIIR